MTLRVCPLCALRPAAIISPHCLVCAGHGIIELGHKAVTEYDPETVSTAAHLAYEQAARTLDKRPDARGIDPRPTIAKTTDQLVRAGIIKPPKAPAPATDEPTGTPTNMTPPATLVRMATGKEPDMTDQLMIRAHVYPYRPADRPGARGLHLTSWNFHPSSLARIGDPFPFEHDTTTELNTRRKRRYDARAIIFYVTGVAA